MKLSDGQRATLTHFLTNAGTIILGGLILGPFIGQRPFQPPLFAVGIALYAAVLLAAVRLSPNKRDT